MEQNGVVTIFDPTTCNVEWRNIPGYDAYEASSTGLIRHKRLGKTSNFFETKTSKGTYLNVGAKNNDQSSRSRGGHILVCLAYHGLPPNQFHEVNHKDGNKHNNQPDNLEWVTRGENITHAYKEGLRKENRKVVMTDINDGTQTVFYSMSELGRHIGITKSAVWSFVRNHNTDPYNGQYTFRFVTGEAKVAKRDSTKVVYAFDYTTRSLHVFDNLAELEMVIGVKRNTAYWHLTRDSKVLVNGFAFSYVSNLDSFPSYTDEEIEISKVTKHAGKGQPIRVTDVTSNTTKIYGSLPDFAKDVGIKHTNTVRRAIFEKDGKLDNYLIEILSSSPSA